MQKAEVEFDNSKHGRLERKRFEMSCKFPGPVIKRLEKLQRWRRGVGEYKWTGDPEKERPLPFSGEATSILIDSTIAMLKDYREISAERKRTCAKRKR